MIPICQEQGCQVHRTTGPEQRACMASCKLSRDDPPPRIRVAPKAAVIPEVSPPVPKVAPTPKIAKVAPPPAPKVAVVTPSPALHKAKSTPRRHLGTGILISQVAQWQSRPNRSPPWEKALCGVLGVITANIEDVDCKGCLQKLSKTKGTGAMFRSWFASPTRVRPGDPFPGKYEPSFYDYVGPDPRVMPQMRGPFDTAEQAAGAAQMWREKDGKRSDIWLVLVEGGVATHCNVYVLPGQCKHEFQRGGKCRHCDEWCPHPMFSSGGFMQSTCMTCGCLKPLEGSPDFYEIPLGIPQPCTLRTK